MEEKRLNIKGVLLVFFLVMGILIITIGSAYAIYKYQVIGEDSSSLIVGDIYMHYKGQNTGVNIGDAMPSETYDPDSYFEFTIDGKNTNTEKDIWYEIDLVYGDQPEDRTIRLKDSLLKFTLFEKIGDDGVETKVLDAESYESINNAKIWVNKINKNTNEETKITYKLYMWISDEFVIGDEGIYTIGEWNEQVYASVKVNVKGDFNEKEPDEPMVDRPVLPEILPTNMIERLKTLAYSTDKEMIAIDVTDKNNINKCRSTKKCNGKTIEYRYSGPDVNNYIYLKDNNNTNELWRIIGIFEDETSGQYIKIIRDEVLPAEKTPEYYTANGRKYKIKSGSYSSSVYWNYYESGAGEEINNWPSTGLQYLLNSDTQDSAGNKGYLTYLSTQTKSKLVSVKYYLGTVHTNNYPYDNPKEAYKHERDVESCSENKGSSLNNNMNAVENENNGCHVWSGNDATWTGKVGLMYPSDYGLSAISTNWNISLDRNGFNQETKDMSWMAATMGDVSNIDISRWTLSPGLYEKRRGIFIRPYFGWINVDSVYSNSRYIAPVLSLSSSVTWISGDGTKENPYKIIAD